MTSPTFQTIEVAKLYEEIAPWCHSEHPFLDPNYSPASSALAIDCTPFVTAWLADGREDAIREFWGVLVGGGDAPAYALRKALSVRLPPWVQLSETARHELHAIYILMMRAAWGRTQDMTAVGASLAATTLACRQMGLDAGFEPQLLTAIESEADTNSVPGSVYGEAKAAQMALEHALSPIGTLESVAEKLKAVPPMVRLVVYDYVHRGWGSGLRLDLYYDERVYGCGGKWNQHYVDRLGFFDPPDDATDVPPAVTKVILGAALAKRGLQSRKSATKMAMIEQARSIPGLLAETISQTCPNLRKLNSEWGEPVRTWAQRVHYLRPVGAALLKLMGLSSLRRK